MTLTMNVTGPSKRPRIKLALACGIAMVPASSGCSFGPLALENTHGKYYESLRRVYEEQLLRNLIHLRYNENQLALNVTSIAAQYELAGHAEARPFFVSPNPPYQLGFRTYSSILPDVFVSGANRPTISLIPADDVESVRRFFTPITPETFAFLTETSWPIATVLRLWTERVNGVPNASTASGPPRETKPDFERFQRLASLLQTAQDEDLVDVEVSTFNTATSDPLPPEAVTGPAVVAAAKDGLEFRQTDGQNWSLVRKDRKLVLEVNPVAVGSPGMLEVEAILNLVPGLSQYEFFPEKGITPDPLRHPSPPGGALTISLRSTCQVFFFLCNGVEIPPEHLEAGLVVAPRDPLGQHFDMRAVTRGLFEVHACKSHKRPPTAFVAVKYRDYWYYIDDADQASKATFSLMLQLNRLDFGRQSAGAGPFLTLPVGR